MKIGRYQKIASEIFIETSVASYREQFERPIGRLLQVNYLQHVCRL